MRSPQPPISLFENAVSLERRRCPPAQRVRECTGGLGRPRPPAALVPSVCGPLWQCDTRAGSLVPPLVPLRMLSGLLYTVLQPAHTVQPASPPQPLSLVS